MKKITGFISSLGGGGAQGVFVTVMNYYVQLGYSVNIVVDDLGNDVYSSKLDGRIDIYEIGALSAKQSLPKLYKYIKEHNVELAFAFSPEIAVNLIICRKLLREKFVIIARCINTLSFEYKYAVELFRRVVTGRLVKIFYKQVDHVVAQSENMRQDLINNYGFKEDQVTTINNPLASKYENIDVINQRKNNYVLYVGRLEKQKGLDMMLTAFSRVTRKDIELFIVGNGSRKSELKELARKLCISDRVHFRDFNPDVETYYINAKCTLLSSLFEGFPNVLTESIACGTPVVSFNLPSGPEDIIIPDVNGYLVKHMDVEEFTEYINMAIEKDWDYKAVKNTAERFYRKNILMKYQDMISKFL